MIRDVTVINENKEQLGTDSQYFELLWLFEEWNKFQKFKFEYKWRKKLNIIIYDSLSILKSSNDEKYYQLIFKVLHMLNCTQIGIIEYNKILLHLKTPHFWNLFNNQEQIDPSTRYEIIFGKVARIVNMFLIYFTLFVNQNLNKNN